MAHGTILIDLTGNTDGDVICSLVERPFCDRNREGKEALLKRDRPKPSLDVFLKKKPQKKASTRFLRFWQVEYNAWWYTNFEWLCGSREKNMLFCWPCLLFHETENRWTLGVQVDQNSLTEVAHAHDITDDHKRCVAKMKEEKDRVATQHFPTTVVVYTAELSKKDQHNNLVKKNRNLFKRLIDVVMMLYNADLAWCYLLADVTRRPKLKTMFDLAIEHNNDLKEHCEKLGDLYQNVIKYFFRDIMGCIKLELQLFTTSELINSITHPFWSLQVDGITDINGEDCSSVMLRYVDTQGNLQELHLGLTTQNNKSANYLFEYQSTCTKLLAHNDYFVSQSYDGACILVDELLELQNKVMSIASGAVLVPSIEHSLNKVLLQGIANVLGSRKFVAILQDFLAYNPKNVLLYELLKLSPAEKTDLVLDCNLLQKILHERNSFIDSFDEKQYSMLSVPQDQLVQITMFSYHLQDIQFVSFLLVFLDILKATDEVAIALSKDRTNVKSCSSVTKRAVLKLKQISSQQCISDAYFLVTGSREPPSDNEVPVCEKLVALHDSLVENVTSQLSTRYGNNYRQLAFLSLVDSTKFASHNKQFPENSFASLQRLYEKHFRMEWLKDELKIFIYSDKQFYYQSPIAIVKLLIANDLKDLLPESFKLFCLVATMPIWSETYQASSCIERTNSLLQYSKKLGSESMRSELSSVIINSPTVAQLSALDSWHNNLIKRYSTDKNDFDLDLDFKK